MDENKCMFVLCLTNEYIVKLSIFNVTIHVSFMAPSKRAKSHSKSAAIPLPATSPFWMAAQSSAVHLPISAPLAHPQWNNEEAGKRDRKGKQVLCFLFFVFWLKVWPLLHCFSSQCLSLSHTLTHPCTFIFVMTFIGLMYSPAPCPDPNPP